VSYLPFAVSAWIFMVGLYGIVTSRNLIHLIICLAVVQSSTYVLLLAIGFRKGGHPPVFADQPPRPRDVDPIVQALTLTDVVVGTTVTALLLAIAVQLHKRHDSLDPSELHPLKG